MEQFARLLMQVDARAAEKDAQKVPGEQALGSTVVDLPDRQTDTVAAHYNELRTLGKTGRQFSREASVRNFNNWVKAMTISKTVAAMKQYLLRELSIRNQLSVLDLGCGKGGDLPKWFAKGTRITHYCGCDLANAALTSATERFGSMVSRLRAGREVPFGRFICMDLGAEAIEEKIPPNLYFHVASCMFVMHYMFSHREVAHQFFHNVSARLVPGGYFIAISGNASALVKAARIAAKRPAYRPDHGYYLANINNQAVIGYAGGSEDDIWKIAFDLPLSFTRYGCAYTFYLQGAVDNVVEYLVHPKAIEELCETHNLENFDRSGMFKDVWESNIFMTDGSDLWRHMGGGRPVPDDCAWQLGLFYQVYTFRKPKNIEDYPKSGLPLSDDEFSTIL